MIDVGRVCVKIAGRDAGKKAVVVEKIDSNFVLIDGETRRRKCSINHLEPLNKTLDIKKGDAHAKVATAFKTLNIDVKTTKPKTKKTERPRRVRKSHSKEKPKKVAKPKVEKKEEKPKVKKVVKKVTKKTVKKVVKKTATKK